MPEHDEHTGHPPNPLLKTNSLESALKQDPRKKKQAVLKDIVHQLDEILRPAVDGGLLWGVSIAIAVDESLHLNKLYLPTSKAGDTAQNRNKVTIGRRMSLVLLGALMREGSEQVMDFFRQESEVRILPGEEPEVDQTHDDR